MDIRTRIGMWLWPEGLTTFNRYHKMRADIEQDRWWLAHDFPEIKAFADRAISMDDNYTRGIDGIYVHCRWDGDIGRFREQLQRGAHLTEPSQALEPDNYVPDWKCLYVGVSGYRHEMNDRVVISRGTVEIAAAAIRELESADSYHTRRAAELELRATLSAQNKEG